MKNQVLSRMGLALVVNSWSPATPPHDPPPASGLICLFRFGGPQNADAEPRLNITIDPAI